MFNNDEHKRSMSPEEQHIIEKLLANSSSTVQSICRARCNFAILPPSDEEDGTDLEEDSDEEDSNEESSCKEEDRDELTDKVLVIQDIDNVECITSTQQLLPSSVVQNYELSGSQEILTPFDSQESEDASSEDDMTSQYAFSPLKLIVDKLIMMHYDVYPNEICPAVNRSPSFIGINNKDDGLLSGRHSPKLDIPCLHHCGHMIQQQLHPLAKYSYKFKMADYHNCDELEVEVSEQQQEKSVADVSANNIKDSVQVHKKTLKKPSRFKKFTSYLVRKLHFPKKKVVLPQIGRDMQPVTIVN